MLDVERRYVPRDVSTAAFNHPAPGALQSVVSAAGGVLPPRPERQVAVNYGSAAGELAACVSAVGLADRSDLMQLALNAPSDVMRETVMRFTGSAVAPGGALRSGGAWWGSLTPERTLVICEPRQGARLRDQLHGRAGRAPMLTLEDRSADRVALALVGRRASKVLSALGVYGEHGDPRHARPLSTHPVAGVDCVFLLESDDQALVLVDQAHAASVWHAIERAGRPLGLCCVGREAIARFALLHRARLSV